MDYLGKAIHKIDTPALIVDLDKLEDNIKNIANMAKKSGVKLRPHIKTHKTPEIAHMQMDNGAVGITAAKLSEAEVFVKAGIKDVFIGFPTIGEIKAERAALLAKRCRLIVGVDSIIGIEQLSNSASKHNSKIEVRVEIDTGLGRSGASVEKAEELLEKVMNSNNLELDGIFTFRGALFGGMRNPDVEKVGREEGELLVGIAENFRNKGFPIREVSLGSTPTSRFAAQVPGVTEVRPGTYVFYDNQQKALGSASRDSIALTILTTVISEHSKGMSIDGGSKTFQGDLPGDKLDIGLKGYAIVKNDPTIFLKTMSEEHGVLSLEKGTNLSIGDKIEIIPNHVCPTVNLSDYLVGYRNGIVEVIWEVAARGKRE